MTSATDGDAAAEGAVEATPSTMRYPVVGIGASAGGLEAIIRILESMPSGNGMAFVVVLHLSPKHESSAAEILQRATRMPVVQVTERIGIQPNHVYVIPPGKQIVMDDDHLGLTEFERSAGRHVTIDVFFRTLANTHRSRAICIVLTGTGADGTSGLGQIKAMGGVVIAQHPDDAEFESMPKSAISSDLVDFALPAAEISQKLIELWANMQKIHLPAPADGDLGVEPTASPSMEQRYETALREIIHIVRNRTGHDFRHYKRATLLRRIERRLQVNTLADLPAYRDFLKSNPKEPAALLKDLLISVTSFFRDREAFDALEREVLPSFFETSPPDEIRAWVAGCATGEEAYSIASLLYEQAEAKGVSPSIQVFATDIDESAIAVGRAGLYPASIVTDVTPSRLRRFFIDEQNCYRVKKSVREKVLFALHNVLRDPPFSRLDLICCRNLLIYLDRQVQEEILRMFHFALRPGGHLFLGSSESAEAVGDLFTIVDKKHRIFKARQVIRTARHIPSMPLGLEAALPAAAPSPTEHSPVAIVQVHERLRQQYAPPSVLIDQNYEIEHVSDGGSRFLHFGEGLPTRSLLTLIKPELKLELRAALFQARQTGKSIEARRVKLESEKPLYVNITVRCSHAEGENSLRFLVLFNEVEDTTGEAEVADSTGKLEIVQHLETELRRRDEQMQSVLEQSESSNEEMKASNEELQAINEELRSASEELETSKEELQSINEELITVNYELKSQVEETAKINDDLQNLIGSTDIATVFVDRQMRIMRFTPRATQLFNLIPTDIGRPLVHITHSLSYAAIATDTTEVFRSLQPFEREVSAADNRSYIARISPYRTTEDRIDGAVLTFVDITRLRQTENKVQAGEALMRLIAECTRDYAIITMDSAGHITSWNTAAESIFGYSASEVIGQPGAIMYSDEDRANDVPDGEMREARALGRSLNDRWHRRKDGSRFFSSGVTNLLADGIDGISRGFAKICRDFTGGKYLEAEREAMLAQERAATAEAQAANRVKDEFLAIVSHELKHPLNLININAELLERVPQHRDHPVVQRAAGAIRSAVATQAQVIDDMLDLSRVTSGKLTLKRVPIRLDEVIQQIFAIFEQDAKIQNVALTYTDRADGVVIEADPVRLEQIIWNLVSNAIKFTAAGGRVDIELTRENGFAKLTVSDNGQGIKPERLGAIFNMFESGEARTVRQEAGLGIGLALVDQLTRLHGGLVTAHSDGEGRGSRFVVRLPAIEFTALSESSSTSRDVPSLAGRRVLIVDDMQDTLEILGELFSLTDMEVVQAQNGPEALAALRASDFDILLSDLGMPNMSGYQFIKEVRKLPRNTNIPAIALSGYGREVDVEKAKAAGFNAHMGKPFLLDEMIALLRRQLKEMPNK